MLSAGVAAGGHSCGVRSATTTRLRVVCAGLVRAIPRPRDAPHNGEDDEEEHYVRQKGKAMSSSTLHSEYAQVREEHSPKARTRRTTTFALIRESSPVPLLTDKSAGVGLVPVSLLFI